MLLSTTNKTILEFFSLSCVYSQGLTLGFGFHQLTCLGWLPLVRAAGVRGEETETAAEM
jgi:hypothetical protein